MARLNQEHIDYLSEHELVRDDEELNLDGRPKKWVIDILILPKLCVEVDGSIHQKRRKVNRKDEQKNRWLELHGYVLKRFTNSQVQDDIDSVIKSIREAMVVSSG